LGELTKGTQKCIKTAQSQEQEIKNLIMNSIIKGSINIPDVWFL